IGEVRVCWVASQMTRNHSVVPTGQIDGRFRAACQVDAVEAALPVRWIGLSAGDGVLVAVRSVPVEAKLPVNGSSLLMALRWLAWTPVGRPPLICTSMGRPVVGSFWTVIVPGRRLAGLRASAYAACVATAVTPTATTVASATVSSRRGSHLVVLDMCNSF